MHFLLTLGILAVAAPATRYDHSAYSVVTMPDGLMFINLVLSPHEDFCPESGDPAHIRWGATTHLVGLYDAGNPSRVDPGPYFSVDHESFQGLETSWGLPDKRAQGWELGQLNHGGQAPPAGMISAGGTAVIAFDGDVMQADVVFAFTLGHPSLVGAVTARRCPALDAFYQNQLEGR